MPEVNRQDDFGAGMYRGREAPANAVFDAVNCLIDDEGQLFRRAGSEYFSTTGASDAISGIFAIRGIDRVFFWTPTAAGVVKSDGTLTVNGWFTTNSFGYSAVPLAGTRPVALAPGLIAYPRPTGGAAVLYGGSAKTSAYTTGTVAVAPGSRIVTGVGTSWVANADAGMIFAPNGLQRYVAVASVDSNTQLTLAQPWGGVNVPAGTTYSLLPFAQALLPELVAPAASMKVGQAAGRLLQAGGSVVYFSNANDYYQTPVGQYHELPEDAAITGIDSLGDTALVFTTGGVWAITNLAFDPLDDFGNDQHTVRQLNELILWGDAGIANYGGALVVPCVDDVYLMTPSGEAQPVGAGVRPLLRDYLTLGYQPGLAAVYRGHYVLPIMNGTTVVDVLVCRLDRGAAWTRWSGHAAGPAFAQRVGTGARSPKLLSAAGTRVTDLTGLWTTVSGLHGSEADGSTHPVLIDTRDYATPSGGEGATTLSLRVRYEADGVLPPFVTASYSRGLETSVFTALDAVKGGLVSDGLDWSVWRVNKQAPAIRFRIESASAASWFRLRSIEAPYRLRGVR